MKKTIVGFIFFIALLLSLGSFSQHYPVENNCSNIDVLVERNYSNSSDIKKYAQKSLFMGLGLVSNIVPLFSFDKLFQLIDCNTKQN